LPERRSWGGSSEAYVRLGSGEFELLDLRDVVLVGKLSLGGQRAEPARSRS